MESDVLQVRRQFVFVCFFFKSKLFDSFTNLNDKSHIRLVNGPKRSIKILHQPEIRWFWNGSAYYTSSLSGGIKQRSFSAKNPVLGPSLAETSGCVQPIETPLSSSMACHGLLEDPFWLVVFGHPNLKKIRVRQLGWWHSNPRFMGKSKMAPKPPTRSSISRWDFPLYTNHFWYPHDYGNPHLMFHECPNQRQVLRVRWFSSAFWSWWHPAFIDSSRVVHLKSNN